MNTVVIARNPLEAETWETFEAEDVCKLVSEQFEVWPDTARIYHEQVSEANDVTPVDEASIERLQDLTGHFFVVVYPGDPTTIIVAVLALAAAAAAAFFLMPAIPSLNNRNVGSTSPNNELSNRTNSARPKARIPDIFGTVHATPDLLMVPYKVFENNIEVEYCYMCLGRGYYDVSEIRDDKTLAAGIAGTKVEVYAPFTSPNSGHAPQYSVGEPINELVRNVTRSNAVNGQLLRAPNANNIRGNGNIRAVYPDKIQREPSVDIDFTEVFQPGDALLVSNLTKQPFAIASLAGTYTILAVTSSQITISPSGNWIGADFGATSYQSSILSVTSPFWVGPFIIEGPETIAIYANFVAPNGMFKDSGTSQIGTGAIIELGITPVNNADVPTGPEVTYQTVVAGNAYERESKASTLYAGGPLIGRCSIRARRISDVDLSFDGQVSDDVKWRDAYAVSPVNETQFGNVTTVQSVTIATDGALTVKDRRLNMVATRKLPRRISGNDFTVQLYPTNRADEILAYILLDKKIGNRSLAECDFDNIYGTVAEIEDYFGTEMAIEFSYTFDDMNISFEETIASISSSTFSVAYRRGNVIKLAFEKQTEDSMLLFNHRNKLPDTEIRSIRFGNQDDNDGIEFEYISPIDGAQLILYLPSDFSAINPKTIKIIGCRSRLKAYFHAHRAWNKIRYQNTAVEFEATQEADLLVIRDRVLVTDNTRDESLDGQVEAQNGLELMLSQPVELAGSAHTIFLQHIDGTVEGLPVTQGGDPYKVILGSPPKAALALADDLYAKATFSIVGNTNGRTQPFLITEKNPQSNFTLQLSAVNYDGRYYGNDFDFINGDVDANGN